MIAQLYGITYFYVRVIIFKQIYLTHKNGILTGTTIPSQSEPESKGNEGVLHTSPELLTTEYRLVSYQGHPLGESYLFAADTVSVF